MTSGRLRPRSPARRSGAKTAPWRRSERRSLFLRRTGVDISGFARGTVHLSPCKVHRIHRSVVRVLPLPAQRKSTFPPTLWPKSAWRLQLLQTTLVLGGCAGGSRMPTGGLPATEWSAQQFPGVQIPGDIHEFFPTCGLAKQTSSLLRRTRSENKHVFPFQCVTVTGN